VTERQRDRETERQRDRKTERQKDRDIERQKEKEDDSLSVCESHHFLLKKFPIENASFKFGENVCWGKKFTF
jgi:hypothetical protein